MQVNNYLAREFLKNININKKKKGVKGNCYWL